MARRKTVRLSLLLALTAPDAALLANGVNNNGASGRGRALNGATVAGPTDAIDAMATNPAALIDLDRSWTFGLVGAYAKGRYSKAGERPVRLMSEFGVAPELGLALPFHESLTLGLSVAPEQLRAVEWRYRDAPGGLDGRTSYGFRNHRSEFAGVRSALGLATRLGEQFSLGASAGLVYERINLAAPYIFQSEPRLGGVKAALDLETEGLAFNADLGLIYRASDRLQFGMRYRTETEIDSHGDADGNAGAQFRSIGLSHVPGMFHYDAEVETTLPRSVSAGLSWQAADRVRLFAQTEWINWNSAFDRLTVKLSDGTNTAVNSLAGSDDVVDHVPLDWEDRFVYRLGIEFEPAEKFWLRAGYSYGRSPIPVENITALNAAIAEHTLSAGVGFMLVETTVDIAYQFDLPSAADVGRSNIRSGEYSNSTTEIESHWVGVSVSVRF